MKVLQAIVFCFIYLRELLTATGRLAWLVVQPRVRLSPCFAEMPLDLRGEFPTLLFVCLVSMTPGSLSVSLDRGRNVLLIHLLDSHDPGAEIARMKLQLERPLIRIFGQG